MLTRAAQHVPELFEVVYDAVQGRKPSKRALERAIAHVAGHLDQVGEASFALLLDFLRKQKRVVPFSEICEHFAHTVHYPWHLETALEWLERRGTIEKVGAPFRITTQSRAEVEEAAYFLDS